ncbi:MAG: carbon monoxide dehydrogenase, partial [Deltaproteobacteria bacterium]|nr:carbon monoxide dehydrogenase [Deltaproteobacteria bacterium]
ICGATADTIVARNMLMHIAAGAAAYIHHAKETAKVLSLTAQKKTTFEIKNEEKLRELANAMGLNPNSDKHILAKEVADFYYRDINKPSEEESELVRIFAPKKRIAHWRELGLFPGGAHSEVLSSMTRTMSHINTDPMDLLKNSLSLSISAMYSGLAMATHFQDILLGPPRPKLIETNLGVLDPHTVNILVHGHQPLLQLKILEAQNDERLLNMAKEAGAKGIKVYGSTDVGQELVSRDNVLMAGQVGSWMKQEIAIATGAVDLMVVDFNCTIPGLKLMADRFHTKIVSVEKVVSIEGIERIDFDPEKADEISRKIIGTAIEAFKNRDWNKINIPDTKSTALIGFSKESIFGTKENLDALVNALDSRRVNGIVAIAGCTNPHTGKQRSDAIILAEELIARDP